MHAMLDLETLGKTAGSVVTQVGLVLFDPLQPLELADELSLFIDVQSSLNAGFTVEADTIKWWSEQEPAARKRAFPSTNDGTVDTYHVVEATHRVADWLYKRSPTALWAHGVHFDVALLGAVYDRFHHERPWCYRAPRDTRTLYDLVGGAPEPLIRGIPHRAVDDAKMQATQVQSAFQRLRGVLAELGETGGVPVAGGAAHAFCEAVGAPLAA